MAKAKWVERNIHEVQVKDDQVLRVSETAMEGSDDWGVNIRYYDLADNGSWLPSRRGVRFPSELLDDVIVAMADIRDGGSDDD